MRPKKDVKILTKQLEKMEEIIISPSEVKMIKIMKNLLRWTLGHNDEHTKYLDDMVRIGKKSDK